MKVDSESYLRVGHTVLPDKPVLGSMRVGVLRRGTAGAVAKAQLVSDAVHLYWARFNEIMVERCTRVPADLSDEKW